MKAREYQKNIFEKIKTENSLVVLPTGMGKTFIAFMLLDYILKKFPKSKILFLAPTRPLVEQHYNSYLKHFGELYADAVFITGKINKEKREKIFLENTIIFSTPQCIRNDLKNKKISLEDVSLIIFDEAHRAVKNYSYVYVSKKYKEQGEHKRILGLTASPGHKKESIKKICENLHIKEIELRTRESEDIKPYIKELKIREERVDLPKIFQAIREKIKIIYKKKIEELKKRKILWGIPTKTNLLALQSKLFNLIKSGNKNFNYLRGVSLCAQAIKLQYALELLETQGTKQLYEYLSKLKKESEEKKSKASQQIVKTKEFQKIFEVTKRLKEEEFFHPKLEKLIRIIKEEFNLKNKILIFSQYRDTVSLIAEKINEIEGVKAKVFVGQLKKKNMGLNQKEQQEIIKEFGSGGINVMVSTSIGEEGLDIPEVSHVIFYEPVPSGIRLIQRRGRTARLKPGNLIVLLTRKTRDEAYYYVAKRKEEKMKEVINSLGGNKNSKKQFRITDY